MREREGLIARIRQTRRSSAGTDQQALPSTSRPGSDELRALEVRIVHLEQVVQGLQDSVHRESARLRACAGLIARSGGIGFRTGREVLLCAADLGFGDAGDASECRARAGAEDGGFGGGPCAQLVVGEVRLE